MKQVVADEEVWTCCKIMLPELGEVVVVATDGKALRIRGAAIDPKEFPLIKCLSSAEHPTYILRRAW